MFGLDAPALIVILIIILVIFGGSQLPKLARSLETSAKELHKVPKDDKANQPKTSKTTANKKSK